MGNGVKTPLFVAEEIASSIVEILKPAMQNGKIEIAGSIRRKKSEVSDIEIVGIVADENQFEQSLQNVGMIIKPGTPDIVPWHYKKNAKYVRMLNPDGMKIDIFLANPRNWGGLLMMRTGSGTDSNGNAMCGFTTGMFSRWKKVSGGGKMVGCIPTKPSGEECEVKEEIDIFNLLNMDFVPPELRIDRKIISQFIKK